MAHTVVPIGKKTREQGIGKPLKGDAAIMQRIVKVKQHRMNSGIGRIAGQQLPRLLAVLVDGGTQLLERVKRLLGTQEKTAARPKRSCRRDPH